MKRARLLTAAALLAAAGCVSEPEETLVHFPKAAEAPCDRPEPRPALDPAGPLVLSSQFRPQGPTRAVESARLRGGVRLEVRHQACGREAQAFRFYLPEAQGAPASPADAYALAAKLMSGIAAEGEEGDGLRALAAPLTSAAAGKPTPPLGAVLPMGEFQELMLTQAAPDEGGAYAAVLVVSYRLKL